LFFLENRKGLLDAVVFSGVECLLHEESIVLMVLFKRMGFLIKVDTNGSKPERLQEAIALGLIDFVALDFKATKAKFKELTEKNYYKHFLDCLSLLQMTKTPFEVRTTVHSELLVEEDLKEMIEVLTVKNYYGNYYLQPFRNGVETLKKMNASQSKAFTHLSTPTIWVQMR
jgi:pyruvate formate lyase activating enzyme